VNSHEIGAEGRPSGPGNESLALDPASIAEEASIFCPACSVRLEPHRCKLRCTCAAITCLVLITFDVFCGEITNQREVQLWR
jgi:hypothetical protein